MIKFNNLSNKKKFLILFSIAFFLGLLAIPIVINSERRILQNLSNAEFCLFGLLICFFYAAFLSAFAIGCSNVINKYKSRNKVKQSN